MWYKEKLEEYCSLETQMKTVALKGDQGPGERWKCEDWIVSQFFRCLESSSVLLQTRSLDVILSFSVTEKQKKTKITRRANVCVRTLLSPSIFSFLHSYFQYWLILICQAQYVRAYRSWGPFKLWDRTEKTR